MKRVWKGVFPCVMIGWLGLWLFSDPALAGETQFKTKIFAPPYTQWRAPGALIHGNPRKGEFELTWPADQSPPVTITGIGPLGGKVIRQIRSFQAMKELRFSTGVILDKNPDPDQLDDFPQLCPRVRIAEQPQMGKSVIPMASLHQPLPDENAPLLEFIYDGAADGMNHFPHFQLSDPDAKTGKQSTTFSQMDGKNVLLVRQVLVKYDYEDAGIVDLKIIDPKTGREKALVEGRGGFYANFHYAIFPYREGLEKLDPQTLLHLAQGSLQKIGRSDLRPELRTHSFLPGPFYSQKKFFYELCEWGDTAHQAPVQKLNYENLAVWDWDYTLQTNPDRLMMVIWEGDEEDSYHARKELTPNYLVDDLVAVFTFTREDTQQPLTLTNTHGDFSITLQTGDMKLQKGFPF